MARSVGQSTNTRQERLHRLVERFEVLILDHQFERRFVEAHLDGLRKVSNSEATFNLGKETLRHPTRPIDDFLD